jgi:hypothetical protein
VLAVASVSLIACSSSDNGAPPAGDGGLPDSAVPSADDGGDASIVIPGGQTVGAAGGTVTGQGVTLTVPAGALPGDIQIAVTTGGAVPTTYTGLTPVYVFAPLGTTLMKAATITFDVANPPANARVYWSDGGGAFEPLQTTITVSSVSASITRLGDAFAGVALVPGEAGADDGGADDAGTVDASAGDDASPVADAGTTDAEAADAAVDGATADADILDAGTDAAASTDAGDAAIGAGISVKIGSTQTTFAFNQSVTYLNGLSTLTADDSASTTHWEMQLKVGPGSSPQTCSPSTTTPFITYTHFTSGVADMAYASDLTQGYCNITVTSTAAGVGQHATGTFTGGVGKALDAGGNSPIAYSLTAGSFDLIR